MTEFGLSALATPTPTKKNTEPNHNQKAAINSSGLSTARDGKWKEWITPDAPLKGHQWLVASLLADVSVLSRFNSTQTLNHGPPDIRTIGWPISPC
jgi:hypothetical protein